VEGLPRRAFVCCEGPAASAPRGVTFGAVVIRGKRNGTTVGDEARTGRFSGPAWMPRGGVKDSLWEYTQTGPGREEEDYFRDHPCSCSPPTTLRVWTNRFTRPRAARRLPGMRPRGRHAGRFLPTRGVHVGVRRVDPFLQGRSSSRVLPGRGRAGGRRGILAR